MGITFQPSHALAEHHREQVVDPVRQTIEQYFRDTEPTRLVLGSNPGIVTKTNVVVDVVSQQGDILRLELPEIIPEFVLHEIAAKTGIPVRYRTR